MTDGILLSGKRGSGKSLIAAGMMRDYIERGCMVATNLNLYIEHLTSPKNKIRPFRVPDFPELPDLESLPLGNPGLEREGDEIKLTPKFREDQNGILVLDEVATFLNSRNWQQKERQGVISWLLQSRKYGWDILMIAQHPRLVDAQIRDSLFDQFGTVRRLDKISVPVFGALFRLFGLNFKLPRLHFCILRYGNQPNAPVSDRIFTRGGNLYRAYDTTQKIDPLVGIKTGEGFHYLSAWDVKGRHMGVWQMYRAGFIAFLILGLVAGFFSCKFYESHFQKQKQMIHSTETEKIAKTPAAGFFRQPDGKVQVFVDGKFVQPQVIKQTAEGWQVLVDGQWYKGATK